MEGVGLSGDWDKTLFQGNELIKFNGYNNYDFNLRQNDPWQGRFTSLDPVDIYGISPYAGMMNNPAFYTDPDGDCPVCVVAIIGGVINLGVKASQGQINSWQDGFAAFGIGAAAGTAGFLIGGAAFAAAGGGAAGAGGLLAGLAGGAAGAAASSPIQGLGNAAYFGDPYSLKTFGRDIAFGAAFGGATNGIISLFSKTSGGYARNFITGDPVADGATRISLRNSRLLRQQGWTKGVGGKWTAVGAEGTTTQFPDWVDDLGNVHKGGTYTTNAPQVTSQNNLTLSPRQSLHFGQPAVSGKSYLTENPARILQDLNSGNFSNYGLNHRGMPIIKFDYNIGVSINAEGISLGNTPFGIIHTNKLGQVHIVPWSPR